MDHVVTNNIETNKDQPNDPIDYEAMFGNSFNLSSGNKYPLPVDSVSLQGVKKHRAMNVADVTCLWDNRATNITIKRKQSQDLKRKMRSNKVYYSTAVCLYCMIYDVKVPFCML